MEVSLKLSGKQRQVMQKNEIPVPLTGGGRIEDLLIYVREHYPEIPLPESSLLITINDRASGPDALLKADDSVAIIPLFGGG